MLITEMGLDTNAATTKILDLICRLLLSYGIDLPLPHLNQHN